LLAAEQARERLAELSEAGEDLLAEVRHELEEERRVREAAEATAAADDGGSDAADARPADAG
jgi:hypothetical protein